MVEEAKEELIKVMAVAVMDSINGIVSIYMTCFYHSAFSFFFNGSIKATTVFLTRGTSATRTDLWNVVLFTG